MLSASGGFSGKDLWDSAGAQPPDAHYRFTLPLIICLPPPPLLKPWIHHWLQQFL